MKFSIVIPALNEEKIIEKCLHSIENQGYSRKDYEIITVDGNSKDKTREIARKHGRVVVEKRRGIALARNVGARHVKGDIIVFIDADTIVSSNLLQELDRAYADPRMAGATVKIIPDIRTFKFLLATFTINKATKFSSYTGRALGTTICISCRKNAFRKIGGFNDKMYSMEDLDFVYRLSKVGKYKFISDAYAITAMRRVASWGLGYFLYRYAQGSGLFSKKREYGRVD